MSEGKNIEIKIAATGGDQAAAEVRKVEVASTSLAGNDTKGLKSLSEESKKVTKGNVQMGTGMQNVGSQVQDLAVKIGIGTSAFGALGQQLPQLLSGFGPLGITLGTVAGVALPLAGAMFNLGESAESAGEKAAEAEEKFAKLMKAREKGQETKNSTETKEWLEALDDEEQAYIDQNSALQRQIELLKARREAQEGVDTALRDAAIAKVEADPSKDDATKIREVAKIREEDARAKAQQKLDELALSKNTAANDAAEKTGKAERQRADADTADAKVKELEAEKAAVRGRLIKADSGKAGVESTNKSLADIAAEEAGVRAGEGMETPEYLTGLETRRANLEKQLAEQEKASQAASPQDRTRVTTIDKEIAETKKGAEEQKAQAESAAKAAAEAKAKAVQAAEIEQIKGPAIQQEYTARKEARGTIAESRAGEAEKSEREKKATKAQRALDQAQREAAKPAEEKRRRSDTLAESRGALGLADDLTRAGGNSKNLQKRAEAALRNPSANNQRDLEGLLEKLLSFAEKKSAKGDQGVDFNKYKRRLEIVESQLKNKR